MSTDWFVVYPTGENIGTVTSPVTPPGIKIVSVQSGSADENTLEQGGSLNGYSRFMGPFSSESDAENAHPPSGGQAIKDIIGAGVAVGLGDAAGISNPLTGLAAIGDFFQRLTQKSTWVRIAEVVLGLLLVVVGLSKLSGVSSAVVKTAKAVK